MSFHISSLCCCIVHHLFYTRNVELTSNVKKLFSVVFSVHLTRPVVALSQRFHSYFLALASFVFFNYSTKGRQPKKGKISWRQFTSLDDDTMSRFFFHRLNRYDRRLEMIIFSLNNHALERKSECEKTLRRTSPHASRRSST